MAYSINKKIPATILFSMLLIITGITGCKKFVAIPAPITSTSGANAYSIDASAIAVLTGIYANISRGGPSAFATGSGGISLMSGLSADEFILYGAGNLTYTAYYTNQLTATFTFSYGAEWWNPFYNYIFKCNSAIEGLTASTTLTPAVRQQLLGEGKFMRAFFYSYLVNFFGDVPLVLNTDYQANSLLARTPATQVWQQIITDLQDAQNLLSSGYLEGDALTVYSPGLEERIRPNKGAATALLARAYLYTGNWVNAEAQASAVINNTALYSLSTLNTAFLKNSTEAIWQLQPVNAGWNTEDAKVFILPVSGPGTNNPVYISTGLLHSFEAGDQRSLNWLGHVIVNADTFYYPYKYKSVNYGDPVSEYLMVLRLGEQYLIRAEARAQQGRITEAQNDLNMIRNRAGLPNTSANDKAALLTATIRERQVEFFSEWGHRWLDLKRTENVDAVMATACPQKGGTWRSFQQWYPLPFSDIQKDPNLVQNKGY